MTQLFRVRTTLTGFPGGPGLATMYFLDTATAVASVRAFWSDVSFAMPPDVHINVQAFGDVIEDTTGKLIASWQSDPVAEVVGQSAGGYAAPVGGLVQWFTTVIMDGTRVRGRTFVVPLGTTFFETTGGLTTVGRDTLLHAGEALVSTQSASMVVWHRPFDGSPATATRPARPRHDGGHAVVLATGVPTKVVVLRSRRD